MDQVCGRYGVPLAAAALQFPLGHDCVASVIPGAVAPEQVAANLRHFTQPVPDDLWAELKHEKLLREDAPTG
jgi:D-threo-aldose 1-dehydrogenase